MKFRWYVLPLVGLLLAMGVLSFRSQFLKAPDGTGGTPNPGPRDGPPNVVLISLDTTRPDHLGCYGYPKKTSPNIDRLAQEGVRFAQARSQAPWTLPSHMSLFTSMLPSHNTMDWFSGVLPSEIPMLAQILQKHHYTTAALVNNGQMTAQWGFNRGFDLWREFPEDAPEGDCEHITDQALQWLDTFPAEPFFLFLHYYDPHDPYDPPPAFRTAFGSSLSGTQASRIVKQARLPSAPTPDPELWAEVMGSYDGEIAWLDHELGKLFERLPENTLVVLFSDHGEAFKEHGWAQHGSSLYEEEVRTVLILRHPRLLPGPKVIDEPVMLMDVAPTILSLCGVEPPPHYEGADLSPLWHGQRLPDRLTLAETKSTYVCRMLKVALLGEWKLVYSLLDGKQELYHLPDEHTDLSRKETAMARALFGFVRRWAEAEDFWMVHAHGRGEFTATFVAKGGQLLIFNPLEDDHGQDAYVLDPNGRALRWTSYPKGRTRAMYLQFAPKDTAVHFDFQINGVHHLDKVYLGPQGTHPKELPADLDLNDQALSPAIDKPFQPERDGFFVLRYRGKAGTGIPAQAGTLDEQTIRQLRSLGYLR